MKKFDLAVRKIGIAVTIGSFFYFAGFAISLYRDYKTVESYAKIYPNPYTPESLDAIHKELTEGEREVHILKPLKTHKATKAVSPIKFI